jgi:uncharacterized membrane protein YbhN (UPF0104 family)
VWTGKLLLAILLLVLLLQHLQTDSLLETFAAAQPLWLLAAFLLLFPNIFFQYVKWRTLLLSAYPDVRSSDVGASLLLGFAFGVVTPARIGEFGGRAAAVRNTDKLTLMSLTAVDKLATLVVTVGAGAVGLLLFCIRHPFMSPLLLAALESAAALVAAGMLMWMLRRRKTVIAPSEQAGPFTSRWLRIRRALTLIDAPVRARLLLFSALFYATFVLQFMLLLRAFGPLDILSTLAGVSTIMLIKTVIPPLTLGELGIREGASVFVLGHAGMIAAAAVSASLLLFGINILLPGLVGVFVMLRRPERRSAA